MGRRGMGDPGLCGAQVSAHVCQPLGRDRVGSTDPLQVLAEHDEVVRVPQEARAHRCSSIPFGCVAPPDIRVLYGRLQAMERHVCQHWRKHPSHNSAKKALEFTIAIPRAELRPQYGSGFAGAPIEQRGITRARQAPVRRSE